MANRLRRLAELLVPREAEKSAVRVGEAADGLKRELAKPGSPFREALEMFAERF